MEALRAMGIGKNKRLGSTEVEVLGAGCWFFKSSYIEIGIWVQAALEDFCPLESMQSFPVH